MIRATDLRLVSDWAEQLCPVCHKPLLKHILATQEVTADFSRRTLRLNADVFCGANSR